jgi:hypothetical protein
VLVVPACTGFGSCAKISSCQIRMCLQSIHALYSHRHTMMLIFSVCRCALMEKPLKLKLPMAQLLAISVLARKEVKPARIALLLSLLGQEDLRTGTTPTYLTGRYIPS